MKNLTLKNVRFSYLNVFTPRPSMSGGEPKYSTTILIPKFDLEAKAQLDQAIAEATQDGIASRWNGRKPAIVRSPLHDGDGVRQNGEPFGAECKGHWVLNASSKQPPKVVDAHLQDILDPSACYSGMYGKVNITLYPYSSAGNNGVGCGLNGLQKLRDGEPLGGLSRDAQSMFGEPEATPTNHAQSAPPLVPFEV